MGLLIVTNNPEVAETLRDRGFKLVFLDGPAQASLRYARDKVVEGWRLAADPLAGYKRRFNPYHTVFLSDDDGGDISYDVLRLEKAALHLDSSDRPTAEDTPRIHMDYRTLDLSLASNTLDHLGQYYHKNN